MNKNNLALNGTPDLLDGNFWHQIPQWSEIDAQEFNNHLWQDRNAAINIKSLSSLIEDLVSPSFLADIRGGIEKGHMALRITPYLLALIDWKSPEADPIRRQFLPLASEIETDHPMLAMDPMHEQGGMAVEGLTHRYQDRVLFLATDVCPVYCKYCTRSYAVGTDTQEVVKVRFNPKIPRWEKAFEYIQQTIKVEDVVISGGDCYRLKPDQIRYIGERLLAIPHIRRIRFATKGLAVMPMKIISDNEWLDALTYVSDLGKSVFKSVAVHTHFNHPTEITEITLTALKILFDRGIKVRNQGVLLNGVNNDPLVLIELNHKLNYLNIRPYYMFLCDMVKGTENMRTSLSESIEIEKQVRGTTAGHNMPTFVVDLAGGGGKRVIHSHETYNEDFGLSAFRAPSVKKNELFLYCDPLRSLDPYFRNLWLHAEERKEIIKMVTRDVGITTKNDGDAALSYQFN